MGTENKNDMKLLSAKFSNSIAQLNRLLLAFTSFFILLFCIFDYFFRSYAPFLWVCVGLGILLLFAAIYVCFFPRFEARDKLWTYLEFAVHSSGIFCFLDLISSICLLTSHLRVFLVLSILLALLQAYLYLALARQQSLASSFAFVPRLIHWAKGNRALTVVSVCAILFFLLWMGASEQAEDTTISAVFASLFGCFFSSTITIAVVNRLLEQQQARKERPRQESLYRDVQMFTSRLIAMWTRMYLEATPQEAQKTLSIEQLFSEEQRQRIGAHLDLSHDAPVRPQQKWLDYLSSSGESLVHQGKLILTRYGDFIEPELFHAVHFLITDSSLLSTLSRLPALHQAKEELSAPSSMLDDYLLPITKQDTDAIQQVHLWCQTTFQKLDGPDAAAHFLFPVHDTIFLP